MALWSQIMYHKGGFGATYNRPLKYEFPEPFPETGEEELGYRMFTLEFVYEIYRRLVAGQSQRSIGRDMAVHRESIREYHSRFKIANLPFDRLLSKEEFSASFNDFKVTRRKRSSESTDQLVAIKEEIETLLTQLDFKSAHEILIEHQKITSSYSTFKRYVRSEITNVETKSFIRIELPPGKELQMDYGKMGMLINPRNDKRESIHAFVGILANSRLPFIQFVTKQNQESFTKSFISMFEFYDGVPEYITIDNLKTGVNRPDLYDPEINKSFLELAQHYGTFISPARIRTPTDKGKVERMIPVVRRLFKKLTVQYPGISLEELNKYANQWIQEEYGKKKHGTTGIPPLLAFEEEKKHLKKLPEHRFEVPVWKLVKVHPDQFIQFEKCRYSVPYTFKGDSLMACKTGNILRLFKDSIVIKEHVMTGKHIIYDKNDFPEVVREMMDGSYGKYILNSSKKFGELSQKLIENILETDGWLHTRQAQGVLRIIEDFRSSDQFEYVLQQAIYRNVKAPVQLKKLFEESLIQETFDFSVPRSELGNAMVRSSDYYFND